jgi:hypothetical protein
MTVPPAYVPMGEADKDLMALAQRLTRLESRFVSRETEDSRRILERLRQAREPKHTGQPYPELPPLPPTNNGHPWTIGDCLVTRREQIRRLEAA